LYAVTSAPLSVTGADQLITTELTTLVVVGATGYEGATADLIATGSEIAE